MLLHLVAPAAAAAAISYVVCACFFTHQALAALNEYHAAVSETSVTIRNKPAYLMGILRKYKQGQRAPLGNGATGGMATTPNAMGRMGVRTRAALEVLRYTFFWRKCFLDDGAPQPTNTIIGK